MKTLSKIITILGLLSLMQFALAGEITDTYATGDPLTAAKMNNIKAAVNDNNLAALYRYRMSTWHDFSTTFGSFGSEIASASCPVGAILTGSAVGCYTSNTDFSTTNMGLVTTAQATGETVIGACVAEAMNYSGGKYGPSIMVTAFCASSLDGLLAKPALAARTADGAGATPGQGELSEEALLLKEKMISDMAARIK